MKIINMSAQKPMFLASLLFVILQRLECCSSIPHNAVPSDFLLHVPQATQCMLHGSISLLISDLIKEFVWSEVKNLKLKVLKLEFRMTTLKKSN